MLIAAKKMLKTYQYYVQSAGQGHRYNQEKPQTVDSGLISFNEAAKI